MQLLAIDCPCMVCMRSLRAPNNFESSPESNKHNYTTTSVLAMGVGGQQRACFFVFFL